MLRKNGASLTAPSMTSAKMHKGLLLSFLVATAAYGSESKVAGRVFLSSGEVAEVICTRKGSPTGATATLTARFSSGIVVTVSSKEDLTRRHGETRISDGKTVLEFFEDSGYYSDNLPVPLQVKIGDTVYRVLLKPNALTNDQKKSRRPWLSCPHRLRRPCNS